MKVDFPPLIRRLNETIHCPKPQPRDIHAILVEMDPVNKWFYEKSLSELSDVTETGDE